MLSLSPMDYPSVVFICVDNSIRGSSVETESLSLGTMCQTACLTSWSRFLSLDFSPASRCGVSKIFTKIQCPYIWQTANFPPCLLLSTAGSSARLSPSISPSIHPPSEKRPAHQPGLDPAQPTQCGCCDCSLTYLPDPTTFPLQPPIALWHFLNKILVSQTLKAGPQLPQRTHPTFSHCPLLCPAIKPTWSPVLEPHLGLSYLCFLFLKCLWKSYPP